MKLFIGSMLLIIGGGGLGYAMFSNSPIKTEQYDIVEQTILNANCTWDVPYMVPVTQMINGVTTMTLETRFTIYSGYQNQVVRYWTERNTYRNGKISITKEARVIQELTACQ